MVPSKTREELTLKTSTIMVVPLNLDAINKDIDKSVKENAEKAGDSSFAPKIEPNQYFGLHGKFGVIKGTNILIDTECIGEVGDEQIVEIFSEKRNEEGKRISTSMFSTFKSKVIIKDLVNHYACEEVSLKDFMGSRFCYNPRICSNISEILKELKKN